MSELECWLKLCHTPGIGGARLLRLLHRFGTAVSILDASDNDLQHAGLATDTIRLLHDVDPKAIERDIEWAEQPGHNILMLADAAYPQLLREIGSPPPVLYVNGHCEHLSDPQLAMVGSRSPSAGGRESAYEFAHQLATAGLGITSGLALGVDGASHEGALAASGLTIAVAATGMDRIYPAKHRDLAYKIIENGAIISEFPIGTQPKPDNFPRRNRIISGLSLGTLVVEAARKSGSLITARYAVEQAREVFAIPGSIHNPMTKGCHQLIREGAKLVETAEDVLVELTTALDFTLLTPSPADAVSSPTNAALDDDYLRLLEALGYDPTSIDVIVERSGLTAEAVSSMLLILELKGLVVTGSAGLYTRTAT